MNSVLRAQVDNKINVLDIPIMEKKELKRKIFIKIDLIEKKLNSKFSANVAKEKLKDEVSKVLKEIDVLYSKKNNKYVIDWCNDAVNSIKNYFSYKNTINISGKSTKKEKSIVEFYLYIIKNDIDIINEVLLKYKYNIYDFINYINILNEMIFKDKNNNKKYIDKDTRKNLSDAIKGVE